MKIGQTKSKRRKKRKMEMCGKTRKRSRRIKRSKYSNNQLINKRKQPKFLEGNSHKRPKTRQKNSNQIGKRGKIC